MSRGRTSLLAAITLSLAARIPVWGQLTILDQTRSISVYADAAVFLYLPPPDPDVTSQNSDTDVLTGGYSNSLSANVTNPVSLYTVVGTAEQSSNVSSSGLSGSGTTSSSATAGGQFEGETSE